MGTKAQTLDSLRGHITSAKVLDLTFFSYDDWQKQRDSCISSILNEVSSTGPFIVRSSALSEDQQCASNAGKYTSILNVEISLLESAIEQVFSSYGDGLEAADEVLIQPMLSSVRMSGVMFTKDVSTGADYYVIEYIDGGDTTAVTSGKGLTKSHYISYVATHNKQTNPFFNKLIGLAEELKKHLRDENLDIEFAFDLQKNLYLFQVRPLRLIALDEVDTQEILLDKIRYKYELVSKPHPYLHGDGTVLGVMPDWNPAEIIGIRPRPLALSLYKEIITDGTWAYQRDNYGYKNLRSFPLLIDLIGLPYIDVRVSFNSFIPKALDDSISQKLVNYYLSRLKAEPALHDKVEFNIVFSCYTFDLNEKIQALKNFDFSDEELSTIADALKSLTNFIIHRKEGLWLKDIEKINELQKHHQRILYDSDFDEQTKIYWLIQACKRYGTLPFAGLARAAFIAVQLLNSMESIGILSSSEKGDFLGSLESVSYQMKHDICTLEKQLFLHKYGHLRPGTYDILSKRYDECADGACQGK